MASARSSRWAGADVSRAVSFPASVPEQPSTATLARATILNRTRMLEARGLTKEFDSGTHRLTVLRDVSFRVPQGALVAIVGPSGSGKTTLLGLLAGLDTPSRGQVLLDDADLTAMSEDQRAQLRGAKVGFVFQSFQLIPTLTAIENVQVPLELRGEGGAGARARALLERVGLGDRLDHFPSQLSGGEQQRVAIARAFVNRPRILFADEPTGNLDGTTGAKIVALLEELNRESGSTIVLVTHDLTLAERTQRIIRLADGLVVEDRATAGAETQAAPSAPVSPPATATTAPGLA
ncbi:MAG: ABC transporter ATP-binding protein [Gemmatimonadaceae bacterium]|nr:ABC transporter ATP-binding protein [Gemmatimonadaceae bacterium]